MGAGDHDSYGYHSCAYLLQLTTVATPATDSFGKPLAILWLQLHVQGQVINGRSRDVTRCNRNLQQMVNNK